MAWRSRLGDKRIQAALGATMVVMAVVGSTVTAFSVQWDSREQPQHPYNVTFNETAVDWGYCSGWIRYGTTILRSFTIESENLTWVYLEFVWTDDVGSPFADPDVLLTFASPNGTVIYDGPAPSTRTIWNVSLNPIPEDVGLMAESEDQAIEEASKLGGVDPKRGVGNWSWTLDVGEMPFARDLFRSGVNYQCWFGFGALAAAASNGTGQ